MSNWGWFLQLMARLFFVSCFNLLPILWDFINNAILRLIQRRFFDQLLLFIRLILRNGLIFLNSFWLGNLIDNRRDYIWSVFSWLFNRRSLNSFLNRLDQRFFLSRFFWFWNNRLFNMSLFFNFFLRRIGLFGVYLSRWCSNFLDLLFKFIRLIIFNSQLFLNWNFFTRFLFVFIFFRLFLLDLLGLLLFFDLKWFWLRNLNNLFLFLFLFNLNWLRLFLSFLGFRNLR